MVRQRAIAALPLKGDDYVSQVKNESFDQLPVYRGAAHPCCGGVASIMRMYKLLALLLPLMMTTTAADLPTKKWLNLAAIKTMVAAAEAEAQRRSVQVTICIVDEGGNLLFLQKADSVGLNTIQFAQKKARYAALYRRPSKAAADQLGGGDLQVLVFPEAFPNQGGLPIQVEGQTIGAIAASGAPSEVDEAIAQAAIDALLKK
ncbi:MAG: heme-binding protein [Acidobacteriales bacterium]|nr:MAG: heme-binding protein [Terriglobales bacterium]